MISDFIKYYQAKKKAKAESKKLIDNLKEKGPKDNEYWKPEELEKDVTKILYESELIRTRDKK